MSTSLILLSTYFLLSLRQFGSFSNASPPLCVRSSVSVRMLKCVCAGARAHAHVHRLIKQLNPENTPTIDDHLNIPVSRSHAKSWMMIQFRSLYLMIPLMILKLKWVTFKTIHNLKRSAFLEHQMHTCTRIWE